MEYAKKHKNLIANLFKKAGMLKEINNLGGSHGRIGFEYRQIGEIHEIPKETRRKIMFEILEHKTGKDYSPSKNVYKGSLKKRM